MDGIWLTCKYKEQKIDVTVEDVDVVHFIDLVDKIIEGGIKQGIYLPGKWRMYNNHRSKNW